MENRNEMVKGWVKVLPFYLFTLLLLLASCKEEDDTIEEYPNWQATNEAYFSNLVSETQAKIDAGDSKWNLLKCYTKPDYGYSFQYYDYIVVEKLAEGNGTTSPLSTDSVEVNYAGCLLPSANKYKNAGYQFDSSYSGEYDPVLATPVKMSVYGNILGFSTALMHMHRGDYWRVYIPYQLGYGAKTNNSIPAYSTLIFDLQLVDFWQKEQGDRN